MIIVSKNLEIVTQTITKAQIPENIKIICDTEFTQKSKMVIDIIGIFSPSLNSDNCYCYLYEDLSDDFNPILEILKVSGYDVEMMSLEDLEDGLLTDLGVLQENLFRNETNAKALKNKFFNAIKSGYFQNLINTYNVSIEDLKYKRERKNSFIEIDLPKINVKFEFFFGIADLFKIWGKKHQEIILNSQLNQYRVLKFQKPESLFCKIDGKLYELLISLSDCFYRIPPVDKSLNGNAKALGLGTSKIEIKTDEIAREIGLLSGDSVISNFSMLRAKLPSLAAVYNAQDIFLTDLVSDTQQLLLNKLRDDFNLTHRDISDTTGSIVSKFIQDCLYSNFGILNQDKENSKLIQDLFSLTKIKNLQEIQLNDFGIQPFLTVGGLLFSRTAKFPIIEGNLSDCDLSSCYATFMSDMSIYLGEPVTRTFKYQKYKPKLREIIEFIKAQKIPRDAWFVRVSGDLEVAINTLVMSDLRFVAKKILCPTVSDLNPNRKSVEKFNAFKTPKKQAVSTLLLKQIKFGLVNADIFDCIKLLPNTWIDEYLDLACDALVYFPTELIVDSLSEFKVIRDTLPDECYVENFNPKNGIKNITTQYYKNNAVLKFDIGKFWKKLKNKRSEYKKNKNAVQEIFKLVGNSGYGVLACLHLATNNLVASNMITAGARSAAWLMTNALNGFAPITDGTSFNWNTIPINLKFRDILNSNPNYLFDFNPNIQSKLSISDIDSWIDGNILNEKFKQHLFNFYEIDKEHIVANRFNFELKEETFFSNNKAVKTLFFKKYFNTNAGNYSKGMNDCTLLINDSDYDFNEQNNYIKARSFDGKNNDLIEWYLSSIKDKYVSPIIYSENKILKFGDGNNLAIRLLEDGFSEIAHPMGFATTGFKMMKIISRSQFLFINENQLKNFETNEFKLSELSNHIFTKSFWSNLTNENLKEHDTELIENVDYYKFSRSHAVGIGFEILALTKSKKGSIKDVRVEIFNKILNGCKDFNAALNIDRSFKNVDSFKYLLASIIVKKANAENELISCLLTSAKEPTVLSLSRDNVKILKSIWQVSED